MSFFKDFKEDLSQAVNELLPGEDGGAAESMPEAVKEPSAAEEFAAGGIEELLSGLDTMSEPEAAEEPAGLDIGEIEKLLSGLGDPDEKEEAAPEPAAVAEAEPEPAAEPVAEAEPEIVPEPVIAAEPVIEPEPVIETVPEIVPEPVAAEEPAPAAPEVAVKAEEPAPVASTNEAVSKKEDEKMSEAIDYDNVQPTDENGVITEGMVIKGDIISKGSLEVIGTVTGNIEVRGKLDISGTVNGDSKAAEIFADSAKITGQVTSMGSVKVGQSSVIVGNIQATSAVIAGAVKGDIDVHGPVILDTSAIVMGNIKSKSVQINNGAVIEGHCSQCYAEVSPTSFFNDIN